MSKNSALARGLGLCIDAALRVAQTPADAALKQVDDYYKRLLACRVETPEPLIDQAFRSALYNLEYNWLEPYGWVGCIHHWYALWHMQHTGAAERCHPTSPSVPARCRSG